MDLDKKQRIENIKNGQKKALEFENQYEQALMDLGLDYIRAKQEPWDFVIITPLDYVFVELKYKRRYPNKNETEFLKQNWTRYLLISKENPNYVLRHYYKPLEQFSKEHTLYTPHQIAFYPVFRLFKIYDWFIEEYLKKVGRDNILLNYRYEIFTTALRYIPNLDILSPKEVNVTQNVNWHLFAKDMAPIILTKSVR